MSFTQLRQEKDEEDEQDKVDVFWKGVYSNQTHVLKDSDLNLESSQQREMSADTIDHFDTEGDLPTYTQTEFKQVSEEETSIKQKIETIREDEEEEEEIDLFSEFSFKVEDNISELGDFSSQLPLDEDDGSNFLSESQIINDPIPYTRNDSSVSYPVNNQSIYDDEEEDFIPATQVYEIPNLTQESQSSNDNLLYRSQEESTISFFKERSDNVDTAEIQIYSQDSLRASLGIEMSPTGIEFTSSLTEVRSQISSAEKSSASKENSDELFLRNEKETEGDSNLTGIEDLKRKFTLESYPSVPSWKDRRIPLLLAEEDQQTTSKSQPNQTEEFDLCPATNTIPKTEENEESAPHSSQVNFVERHGLIVNEEEGKNVIQHSQLSIAVSPLSPDEKMVSKRIVQPVSSTKKRYRNTTESNEDDNNSPKRKKANESPENYTISNDADSNHDTTEGIKNVDQTLPASLTKKRDRDITDSNEDNSPKRQKANENYPISNNADTTEGMKIADQTQRDNTNQAMKDTAIITTVGMKDKEIVADWDSDVEEELDYKYIKEMEDFF